MHFELDLRRCQDQGQCVFAAPEVFRLDGEHRQSLRSVTDADVYISAEMHGEDIQAAQEAADVCPLQAIELVD
jgi:ferredoxin